MKYAGDTTRITYEELVTLRSLKERFGSPLSSSTFSDLVDLGDLLEDGETLDDLIMEDPDTSFYIVQNDGNCFYGMNGCGVDRLFTHTGTMPSLDMNLDTNLNEQCRRNYLAWVLSPCGSLMASGPMGENEKEVLRTSKLARFEGSEGSTRLQLLVGDKPVSGMHIKNNTVEALYTDFTVQGKGMASRLFDYAYKLFPELQHNQSLTADGKIFVSKYEKKRAQHKETFLSL